MCQNALNIISSTSVSRNIQILKHSHVNVMLCNSFIPVIFIRPSSSHFCIVTQFYVHCVIVVIFIILYTHQVRKFSIRKTFFMTVQ